MGGIYASKTYVGGWDDVEFVCNGGMRHTESRSEVVLVGYRVTVSPNSDNNRGLVTSLAERNQNFSSLTLTFTSKIFFLIGFFTSSAI